MKWEGNQHSTDWLFKSALGVLKQFSDLSTVNQRLLSRDFSFSSHFLGDKRIVWQFDSETDCIGFIKNRFFWDDCFMSMEFCPPDAVARSRLRWVDVYGVPLRCWHPSFFMRVGMMLGVPLFIKEETMNKSRLDRGHLLISVPLDSKCREKINVSEPSHSFVMTIVEDANLVDQEWVNRFLGLWNGDPFSNSNLSSESECNGRLSEKVGAQFPVCQHFSAKHDKRHSYRSGCHGQGTYRQCNTAVNLEKRKVYVSSDGETSFSSSDFSNRIRFHKSECSKRAQGLVSSGSGACHDDNRPDGLLPNIIVFDEDVGPSSEESRPSCFGTMVPEIDLDPIMVGPLQHFS
ncbi:hypothetical protein LWI29_016889 [Acer saccharum]|uniref:DUF4283 domain-containing protein n=1 Tax=Acer saccharum TaxID=4024 RepID=A0AA39VFM0_ACESA|nr:hypothetical protein LWI29_016889 [Acer saccharum]